MSVTYSYDQRGRLKVETATLTVWGVQPVTAKTFNEYDALGRPYKRSSRILNGATLETASSYTLQGWVDTLSVSLNGSQLFVQTLGYDSADVLSGTTPQYSGLMAKMIERWMRNGRRLSGKTEGYAYDQAGRLSKSIKGSTETEYAYDEKGNIRSVRVPSQNEFTTYSHMGYRLISSKKQDELVSKIFLHDALGRMTRDGLTGQQISYNDLDLIGNITRNDTTLVNYYYLADGTKISALDGSGEGLVYRGPFVYRTSDGGSSLTLESAAFGGGLMTPSGAMFYVTDYLGSVRAVVDGQTGELYKASNYAVFGEESVAMAIPQGDNPPQPLATAVLPDGQTLRDGYTGKEDQDKDFGTGYIDFGARQYSPSLRRWMTPDPLSEKYYGTSPYAFCNNNPVNFVDPDGMREWPVNPQYNGFKRRHENNYRNPRPKHNGVDINIGAGSNDLGAPVYATHDGIVTRYVTINDDSNAGGNRMQITSENGEVATYYMHLNSMSNFKVGDYISEGTIIGTIGGSGNGIENEYTPHLHYELKVDGEYVNPAIDSQKLVDPQMFITPVDMGILSPAIVEGQGRPLAISLPVLQILLDKEQKLKYEIR